MTATVAEVLDRAAELIETRGHAKGQYEAPDGRLCVVGALRVAMFGDCAWPARASNTDETLYYAARRQLIDTIDVSLVTRWNDNHARTQADVVAGLRAAAQQARDAVKP